MMIICIYIKDHFRGSGVNAEYINFLCDSMESAIIEYSISVYDDND